MRLPRNAQLWLPGYLRSVAARPARPSAPGIIDVMLCLADHYEPRRGRPGFDAEKRLVQRWADEYPPLARQFVDADGCHPRHTFFYPEEEYRPEHLESLAVLCRAKLAEVEVHLHHDRDTSAGLREKLERFTHRLSAVHGLLSNDRSGQIVYGFIHGNWALDNSRPDGRWCGVNDEITVLRQTGCYADFTMPSAPDITQTRTVNSIYYAIDDPAEPKSHDSGPPVRAGRVPPANALLMVQGPLALDWDRRKSGVLPRVENGDLHVNNPPTGRRLLQWLRAAIHVQGRPEWVFIKLHTHGAVEQNAAMLLGPAMVRFHAELAAFFNANDGYRLHYVTAREMANIAKAAEAGMKGDPNAFRNYEYTAPGATA